MKKRTAVLVLATVLSLSVVGCGNSAEPQQEELQTIQEEEQTDTQETEQEEQESSTEQEENKDLETDNQQGTEESEEQSTITDEPNDPYDEALALFDENKTYTYDDFCTLVQDAADIIGVNFADGMPQGAPLGTVLLNSSSKELQEDFNFIVAFMYGGPTGQDKCDIYFQVAPNSDNPEENEIHAYYEPHKEEQ